MGMSQQGIAGLLGKGLEVAHGPGVGGNDAQHLAGFHLGERLLGFEDGQRAVQSACIQVSLEFHGVGVGFKSDIAHRITCFD